MKYPTYVGCDDYFVFYNGMYKTCSQRSDPLAVFIKDFLRLDGRGFSFGLKNHYALCIMHYAL
ncbi:MAG: hypothetical protein J5841_07645, partial [Clostridia bacterium]|nr:hypothetical protein [Clostridia bacterium]